MPKPAVTRPAGSAVVFVGAVTIDSIALVGAFPGPDERVVAEDLMFAGGGPAATAAVTAARLGVPAAFVGTVGDDAEGERIIEGLAAEGVDVSGVTREAGARSAASVIVVDRLRGTRAICARPGPVVDISRGADLLGRADWVHADHLGWSAVRQLLRPGPARRPHLSIDAGNPILGFTPDGVDLYVPTLQELERIYGLSTPDALLDAALHDGAGRVVATNGSRGSLAADASGERATADGVEVEVVSTLGAGDVFHGALVAAHVRGLALADALEYANTVAALSCRGLDGRSAIPTHDTVEAHLRARTA
jgi:sulfofructose kinase